MKITRISIKDPNLGEITIHSELPQEVNDKIGTIAYDFAKDKFYFADIKKNENEVFEIRELRVVMPKGFNVGFHNTSGGSKNYTNLYVNHFIGNFDLFQNAVVSVKYLGDENWRKNTHCN
jgi:hypothetical protein